MFSKRKLESFSSIKLTKVRKRAFTLIELLIVIAIIAILATIIIVNVSSARVKSQTAVAKNTLQTFKKAIMLYQSETGKLPATGSWAGTWCHPGYVGDSLTVTGPCLGELSPTYLSDFQMAGPYGKCTAYNSSHSLCYNYHVYGRNIILAAQLNPIEITGPTNITNFPAAPTNNYCDPARVGVSFYCDGYTY